jgi:DNA-binding NarL/FixJ family response regulator
VDFTPLLPQIRKNQARAGRLLGGSRVVLCLGSRALVSFVVGAAQEPERILGAATTESEGLALVGALRPDLLFTSDRLEQGCGISLVVAVKRHHPRTRTLLLVSQEHRHRRLQEAIEACCEGVLLESRMGLGSELTAIRSVCSGGIYIDRQIGAACRRGPVGGHRHAVEALSARETEVLQGVVEGESNGEIAERLIVSVDTVKTHMRNVLMKLQARDRTHAALIGVRLGLVDWPEAGGGR